MKNTHHHRDHRDHTTTHWTPCIHLSNSHCTVFKKACVPTRHQCEPLARCNQTHLAELWLCHGRRWRRCSRRCCSRSCCSLIFIPTRRCCCCCCYRLLDAKSVCASPWNVSQLTETAFECIMHYDPWWEWVTINQSLDHTSTYVGVNNLFVVVTW